MLIVKNLTLSLNGEPLLRNVDFSVAPGEILTLMGPSGSGGSLAASRRQPPDGQSAATTVSVMISAPPTDSRVETRVAASAWLNCGSANSDSQRARRSAGSAISAAAGSSGR